MLDVTDVVTETLTQYNETEGNDYEEMQNVLDECEELGVHFEKINSFRNHFFGGEQNDLYRPEIEDRNRKRDLQKLQELAY